jgi:hypothetical protein
MGQAKQIIEILITYEQSAAFMLAQKTGMIGSAQFYKDLMSHVMREMKGCINPAFVNTILHCEYDL